MLVPPLILDERMIAHMFFVGLGDDAIRDIDLAIGEAALLDDGLVPEVTEQTSPPPKATTKKLKNPPIGDPANVVQFGNDTIEIKPTKIRYQRDRTAAFYRLLKQMPLVDILALQDGVLDQDRSSDKMFFDWLIAVTDDAALVSRNYDKLDTETVYKMLDIFCRVNHIKDDEKKEKAQMEKA